MSVLENAHVIADTIRPRAEEIEKSRRLPNDIAVMMAQAGLFRIMVPTYLGGMESTPMQAMEIIETIANADASAGWCVMIASTTGVTSAYLDKDVAARIFGENDIITGGVFAPMGKATFDQGGYQLSGHWNWASGSANCHWLLGGAMVMDKGKPRLGADGVPETRQFLYPADKACLPDTWNVTGLCGTGSGDMVVDELFIPQEYSLSLAADKPVAEGPLYTFPVFGLLAIGIAAVSLGNARAAIDDLKDLARAKKSQGSSKTIGQRATSQVQLAQAEADFKSARAFLFDSVKIAYGAAQTDGEISLAMRADVRLAATNAVRRSADITHSMYDLAGGSSVFLNSSLQRRMRDAHVATQHMMVSPQTYELIGRVGFDLDTDSTFL